MRIAFLSDIHANLEALEACLASAVERKADRLVFLGDIVGYGGDPAQCVDRVRDACRRGAVIVRGNHDEAVGVSRFRLNAAAEAAIAWTRSVLDAEAKAFLVGLPLTHTEEDRLYVHASAADPGTFPFVETVDEAVACLAATKARLTVVGHVHAPAIYTLSATGKVVRFVPTSDAPIPILSQRRWLAVMGAVGQPRDGNPAAAYGMLDVGRAEMSFVRVAYDIERAASRIRAAGLPASLWQRLAQGR